MFLYSSGRVPLTFLLSQGVLQEGTEVGKRQFSEFKLELGEILSNHNVWDVSIVVTGSAAHGFSSVEAKAGKPWTPESDLNLSVYSNIALADALHAGAEVNEDSVFLGKYTTMQNSAEGKSKFQQDLRNLEKRWNEKLYGSELVDGVKFEVYINASNPFAPPAGNPIAVTPPRLVPAGKLFDDGLQVNLFGETEPVLGLLLENPGVDLPNNVEHPTSHFLSLLSAKECAGLTSDQKELVNGLIVKGSPRSKDVVNQPDTGLFFLMVEWPEAQQLRQRLGLDPNFLYVALN